MIEQMVLVNERFMARHPVAGDSIRINGVRPSNIWTRSVYMEGLLALNEVVPQLGMWNMPWIGLWRICGDSVEVRIHVMRQPMLRAGLY